MIVPTLLAGWPAFPSHSPRLTTLVVHLVVFGVERREPGMEPFAGVVVGVDAGVVGGEMLHLVEAVLDRIGLRLVAQCHLPEK